MDTNGITPVFPMGNNDGMNGGMWLIGLLILLALFNGGFGGNNGNSNAIQNDINRGFDSQNLQAQTRDILGAVTTGTAQTIAASTANASNAINAIKDGNASIIREFGNVETALTALAGKQQECCCSTLRAIDAATYASSQNTQKILDALSANRMAEMQHMENLHAMVVEIISEYRRTKGEPPAVMMELYEYLHEKHIEDATEVKVMQSPFK